MKEIEIVNQESNVFGYLTSIDEADSFNYLSAFFNEEQVEEMKTWLAEQKIHEFAILRNIYVDESDRGQGVCKNLVAQFVAKARGAPVLLLASPDEEHFKLQEWYEKIGFELTIFSCEDGPLMIHR